MPEWYHPGKIAERGGEKQGSKTVMPMRLTILVTSILVALLAGCQPNQPASPAVERPAITGATPEPSTGKGPNFDEKAKCDAEIARLKKELDEVRTTGADQWFKGYSSGYNEANSNAYPAIFADLGEVYLMSGPQPLENVRIELNYKAQGGGYFEILQKVERYHIWRLPKVQFVDENGKQMLYDQKIVSLRLKAKKGGKQIVREGDTLDIGSTDKP